MDVDRDSFNAIVDEAVALCPISRLFAGAAISVDATLDGT
jgi:osmotically inducible protein OsmC